MGEVPLYASPSPAILFIIRLIDTAEMCSGSEAGSYLRRIDFVYHSTLGLRVIKKKKILFSIRLIDTALEENRNVLEVQVQSLDLASGTNI